MNRRNFLTLSTLAAVGTIVPFTPIGLAASAPISTASPDLPRFFPRSQVALIAGETIGIGQFVMMFRQRVFAAHANDGTVAGLAISDANTGQPVIVMTSGTARIPGLPA